MLSTLIAASPLLILLIGIPLCMQPAARVAPLACGVTLVLAVVGFGVPVRTACLAALQGGLFALCPILCIPFGAMLVYNVLKASGRMQDLQDAMSGLTQDRRAQALLIAYGFGGFLEGVCGFGASVAIPASILVGLGYKPLTAAVVSLVANAAPAPFGSLGIPTETLHLTTGLGLHGLAMITGRFVAVLGLSLAFATVYVMSDSKAVRGGWRMILLAGLSFAGMELVVSHTLGATLASVGAGLASLLATSLYLKGRGGARSNVWLFPDEAAAAAPLRCRKVARRDLFLAWLPYLALTLIVIGVNLPATKQFFAGKVPGWQWLVVKVPLYQLDKPYQFAWAQNPGSLMLCSALLTFPFLGISFASVRQQAGKTAQQMVPAVIAVVSILAMAELMNVAPAPSVMPVGGVEPARASLLTPWPFAAGAASPSLSMIAALAHSITVVVNESIYPFLAPFFGALGVFLTGSNTSANALFGNLQKLSAESLNLSAFVMAGAGSVGAGIGKMISPQSIVIAATAVGLVGKEGEVMRRTLRYALPYAAFLGLVVLAFNFYYPQWGP